MRADLLAAGVAAPPGVNRVAGALTDAKPWQQQLQRAQAAGWFCRSDGLAPRDAAAGRPVANGTGDLLAGGHRIHAASLAKPAAASHVHAALSLAMTGNRIAAWNPAVVAIAYHSGATPQATPAGQPPELAISWATHLAPLVAQDGGSAQEAIPMDPRSLFESAPAQEGPAPARFHIEEGLHGLRVWLGVDGTAMEVAAQAGALAAALRRHCERAGLRLAEVTCNGLTVAGDPVPQISPREEP